jgi:hypothetical protein
VRTPMLTLKQKIQNMTSLKSLLSCTPMCSCGRLARRHRPSMFVVIKREYKGEDYES